jgi:DNA-binding CsgD family transcriptional regulator
VYLSSVRNDAATLRHVAWLNEHGAEVRTVPTLPARMIVADRERAILPLGVANGERAIVILRGTNAVAAMYALFEHVWESATPLGTVRQRDDQGVSAEERAALRFLAEGLTDGALARRLGLSERMARRLVEGLISRLGARSRFEAGALAERRGWLE